jgi:hypothetical protein
MSNHPIDVEWRFVEYIPEHLEQGVIYIAAEFGAVMHLCLEGCGERISTPLSPAQWALTFDGETISLWPSVGNWDLPCRSHYIIRKNHIIWAGQWSDEAIKAGGQDDRLAAERHFAEDPLVPPAPSAPRSRFQRMFDRRRDKRKR